MWNCCWRCGQCWTSRERNRESCELMRGILYKLFIIWCDCESGCFHCAWSTGVTLEVPTYKLHLRLLLPCLLAMFLVTVCLLKDSAFCEVFYAAEVIWMCVLLVYLAVMKMTDVIYSIIVPSFFLANCVGNCIPKWNNTCFFGESRYRTFVN
jgi:hypothetical protein